MSVKNITEPTDRQVFKGEIASFWFDGILVSLSNNRQRTVANITSNIALIKEITNNTKVPLLVYLKNSPIPDKETRKFSTKQLPDLYTAMAMVSKPGLAKFIMNILFKLKPPPIPMKSFTDDKEAKQWLMQYR